MVRTQMTDDPKGYYARLELDHDAGPSAIHTAYLRKARLLHPDVPDTGDAAAFVAVKEAYDVLANPLRRAASIWISPRPMPANPAACGRRSF